MAALPERRTRPTIRCLRDDLGIGLPTVDVDLGSIEHPLMDEARRLAPIAPQGQKRILAIDQPLVNRLRHGRWRGAAWLEEDAAKFWLLAGAQRTAGSRDDAYEVFVALHDVGRRSLGRDCDAGRRWRFRGGRASRPLVRDRLRRCRRGDLGAATRLALGAA